MYRTHGGGNSRSHVPGQRARRCEPHPSAGIARAWLFSQRSRLSWPDRKSASSSSGLSRSRGRPLTSPAASDVRETVRSAGHRAQHERAHGHARKLRRLPLQRGPPASSVRDASRAVCSIDLVGLRTAKAGPMAIVNWSHVEDGRITQGFGSPSTRAGCLVDPSTQICCRLPCRSAQRGRIHFCNPVSFRSSPGRSSG
jgi:hypothetical protein